MSNHMLQAVWPLNMPAPQKAVLVALADRANEAGVCWPSVADLCQRTCLCERTVRSAIGWLERTRALTANRVVGKNIRFTLTPAAYAPLQQMHPARRAPPPAGNAGGPLHEPHRTPASVAPEPSKNHNLNQQKSEPTSSAAHAAVDPDPIFGTCLRFLTDKGVESERARRFLGLLRKQASDLMVIELVDRAKREDVSDPIPWLRKAAEARSRVSRKADAVHYGDQDYSKTWKKGAAA